MLTCLSASVGNDVIKICCTKRSLFCCRENSSRAPRLFCDICDVFDAHDTEDCPTQSMGNPNNDHGSVQHYERGEERPYCDDCEGTNARVFVTGICSTQ